MSFDTKSQGPVHPTASGRNKPTWKPAALKRWSTIPLGLTFIAIAIVSEVVLIQSQKSSGKAVGFSAQTMVLIHSLLGFDIHLVDSELSRTKQFLKVPPPNSRSHLHMMKSSTVIRTLYYFHPCSFGLRLAMTP